MLSKIVVRLYSVLLEVGLWLSLITGLIGGWQANGFIGAILGVIGAAIFGAVFLGAFIVLADIRKAVETIDSKLQSK